MSDWAILVSALLGPTGLVGILSIWFRPKNGEKPVSQEDIEVTKAVKDQQTSMQIAMQALNGMQEWNDERKNLNKRVAELEAQFREALDLVDGAHPVMEWVIFGAEGDSPKVPERWVERVYRHRALPHYGYTYDPQDRF